jgi:SAM-dependent methyltransferase
VEQLRSRALGEGWRKLVVDGVAATPVRLKDGPAVKIVDGPRTETVPHDGWALRLEVMLEAARNVHLLAPDGDLHARRTKKGKWLVSQERPSSESTAELAHDRTRHRALPADHPLFRATKISRDKERQVQHYIEAPSAVAPVERDAIRVVDAGCGKAYMSLALVAYGREVGTRVELVGLDTNPSVVDTVRQIAGLLEYDEARFEATSIAEYASDAPIDLLVSLRLRHGHRRSDRCRVRLGAEAIVVAPCCHHELAAQIAGQKDALLRHGPARPSGRPRHRCAARRRARDARLPRRRDGVRLR